MGASVFAAGALAPEPVRQRPPRALAFSALAGAVLVVSVLLFADAGLALAPLTAPERGHSGDLAAAAALAVAGALGVTATLSFGERAAAPPPPPSPKRAQARNALEDG